MREGEGIDEGTNGHALKEKRSWYRQFEFHVLDPETRHQVVSILYMVYAMVMFFHHVYVMLYLNKVLDGSDAFLIPWIIFAVVSILLGRMWKDKGFWILGALLLLRFLRLAIPDFQAFLDNKYGVIIGIYAFFGCYSAGRILGEKNRKRFLQVFCALWTLAVTVLSALGIYAVWNNVEIFNLGGWKIFLTAEGRLRLFYYPVGCGMMTSVSIAVAFIGSFISKRRWYKVLCILSMIIILLAQVLSAARVSYITTAIEISILLCILLFYRSRTIDVEIQKRRKVKTAIRAIVSFVVLTICFTYIQIYMVDGFNAAHKYMAFFGKAIAETADNLSVNVAKRTLNYNNIRLNDFLSGRLEIWEETFQVISENPFILLYGSSLKNVMSGINSIRASQGKFLVAHCHNVLLQTLLEDGIPGLLLYGGIILYFLKHAFRLLLDQKEPMWKRLLPVPAFSCLLGELVDNTTHVNGDGPQMTVMYLFIGLTIAAYSSRFNRINEKAENNDTIHSNI